MPEAQYGQVSDYKIADRALGESIDLSNSVLSEREKECLRSIVSYKHFAFGDGGSYDGKIVHRIDLVPGIAPIAQPRTMKNRISRILRNFLKWLSASA